MIGSAGVPAEPIIVTIDDEVLDSALYTVDPVTGVVTFDEDVDLADAVRILVAVTLGDGTTSTESFVGPKAGFEALATTVIGNGGPGDRTQGFVLDPTTAYSEDVDVGGCDTITGTDADDLLIGGAGECDDDPLTPQGVEDIDAGNCLLYTSPSPRDKRQSRMPSSA